MNEKTMEKNVNRSAPRDVSATVTVLVILRSPVTTITELLTFAIIFKMRI